MEKKAWNSFELEGLERVDLSDFYDQEKIEELDLIMKISSLLKRSDEIKNDLKDISFTSDDDWKQDYRKYAFKWACYEDESWIVKDILFLEGLHFRLKNIDKEIGSLRKKLAEKFKKHIILKIENKKSVFKVFKLF